MDYHFEDFTEEHYRSLLRKARASWPIRSYDEFLCEGRGALWRHDIDMSVHRSLRLAQIEKEEGVRATYFIHLHNQFYHVWEKDNAEMLAEIRDLGHELALHFDPAYYDLQRGDEDRLEKECARERRFIEETFDVRVNVVSFHNPAMGGWHEYEVERIAGMINTYGSAFKTRWAYCSDSNGYWRFRRLSDFLDDTEQERVHVLTHPAWWLPEAAAPRERVSRCVEGRAAWTHRFYDELLDAGARENVGRS